MTIYQKLKWFLTAGITETIGEAPVNRLQDRTSGSPDPMMKTADVSSDDPNGADHVFSEQAIALAQGATDLDDLYRRRADFDGCPLKKTAAHTLNGIGVEHPTVLCLLDTPDTADEKAGRLMSGPAGALLDKMLAAIGLHVATNAYVSTLIPWRTPGNRLPTPVERAVCRPFWEREIALLQPKLILVFGSGPAQEVIGQASLSKARAMWGDYHGIPVRATLSPAMVLKMDTHRRAAWEDLKKVRDRLSEMGTE